MLTDIDSLGRSRIILIRSDSLLYLSGAGHIGLPHLLPSKTRIYGPTGRVEEGKDPIRSQRPRAVGLSVTAGHVTGAM